MNEIESRRPVFRVAAFGLGERFVRLLEIVLRHARHNRYAYSLATSRGPGEFDIALVDMTSQGGPEVASTLARALKGRPVVKVGRRCDPSRPRDDLLQASFTAQVLFVLNRIVEQHLLRREQAAAAARPEFLVEDHGELRRPRVLVVDDSPTVRRQLVVALSRLGIDCEAVGNAQEALDTLAMRRYELVLADVVMPDMDGYRLTRAVRKDRILKGTPVVLLTSRSSPFDLARGALAGCASYLVKPVSLQSLHDTVVRHLRKALAKRRDDGLRFA